MKYNGSFNYWHGGEVLTDPNTGFTVQSDTATFERGCECQIDISIPAKHYVGTDGQEYTYTYDVFIPKYFRGEISVGATIQLLRADGTVIDEFKAQGVDTLNRKYIEVWG